MGFLPKCRVTDFILVVRASKKASATPKEGILKTFNLYSNFIVGYDAITPLHGRIVLLMDILTRVMVDFSIMFIT